MIFPDPVAEEAAYTLENERRWQEYLETLPKCEECDEPLSGEYYEINGGKFCGSCVKRFLRDGGCENLAQYIEDMLYPMRRRRI